MKLAIFGESPADEAAVHAFVQGILDRPVPLVRIPLRRPPGWTGTKVLPALVRHLYYQSEADALIVVVDSDNTPVHLESHNAPGTTDPRCRHCALHSSLVSTFQQLRPIPGRQFRYAIGTAVPAIEAWCLATPNSPYTEHAWAQYLATKQHPGYARQTLKQTLYRTDRPSTMLATSIMVQAMQRLAADPSIPLRLFPNGFGPFLQEIQSWKSL